MRLMHLAMGGRDSDADMAGQFTTSTVVECLECKRMMDSGVR